MDLWVVEHLKICKTKWAGDIWDSRKPLRTSRWQVAWAPGHTLTWPGQTKQLRCPERPDQDVLWEQTQVFQRVQLLEQTQAFFSTFLHCNVAEGAESARATPNAQSSRPTVLSDSNWLHWGQRCRMFGVIGLHWEQHHRIRHWSCLIGRSTCKSDSGRLHGLNNSLWPWSTNRIERAHIYMTLWQSITDKSDMDWTSTAWNTSGKYCGCFHILE